MKAAVSAALLVAVIHSVHLLSSLGIAEHPSPWVIISTALGIFLPPLDSALLNMKSMYAFDRGPITQRDLDLLEAILRYPFGQNTRPICTG